MEHLLTFDITKKHSSKPTNPAAVSKNLVTQISVTIEKFAQLVTQPFGYSFCPATFNGSRKNDNWVQQSLFCLDFDSGLTPEEGLKYFTDLGIRPNVIYTSFSDTPEFRKTRFCFFIDKQITNPEEFKFIQLNLMRVADAQVKASDKACKDFARLFYGGKEVIHLDVVENKYEDMVHYLNTVQVSSDSGKTRGVITSNFCPETGIVYKDIYDTRLETKNDYQDGDWTTEKFDFDKAAQEVQIFADFLAGNWLTHPQLFGLATNLNWIKGGIKLMKETMMKYNKLGTTNYNQNNFAILPYVQKMKYLPSNLVSFSPYDDDAQHLNLITSVKAKNGVVHVLNQNTRITLAEAESLLTERFNEVLEATDNKIYIFKVATGLGKSELLATTDYKAALAFPTHKLKDEVVARIQPNTNSFKSSVNNVVSVPNLPVIPDVSIYERLMFLIESGVKGAANKFISDLIADTATIKGNSVKVPEQVKEELKSYLSGVKQAYITTDNVATTHQRIIKSEFNQHDTYIFDECPLNSLMSVDNITQNEITDIIHNASLSQELRDTFASIDTWFNGLLYNVPTKTIPVAIDMNEVNQEVLNGNISVTVRKFLGAEYIIKNDSKKMSKAVFITNNLLPENKKIIILSATAPVEVYKLIYGDRVKVIEIDNIEQVGEQIQYTKYSFSRQSLAGHKEIGKQVGNLPVITFAAYKSIFQNAVADIHFGNCAGYDTLKGQDIAVVGTPHVPPYLILLYAMAIGVKFKTEDTEIAFDMIEHNGFKFKFNAYVKKELRDIQLALIESELVQAVGRNRILRTKCTTHLYSNFPLKNTDNFIF